MQRGDNTIHSARVWGKKFNDNVERDKRDLRDLRKAGWKVIVLWECEVLTDPAGVALRVAESLGHQLIEYLLPGKREIMKAAEEKVRYQLAHK